MATWDAAYLLTMLNRKWGRPATGDAMTDASKYQRISESQNRVVALIVDRFPHVLYPTAAYANMPTLTTTDSQVFTFGTDANGYAVAPMGKTQIYKALADIPSFPMVEGWDYLNEGTQIRIPNNRTYTGTLYWRGVTPPADIDATHQPALLPAASRELIVIDAVRQASKEANRNPALAAAMQDEWDRAWPEWCLVWKTQFRHGGALGVGFTGLQLALGGAPL